MKWKDVALLVGGVLLAASGPLISAGSWDEVLSAGGIGGIVAGIGGAFVTWAARSPRQNGGRP